MISFTKCYPGENITGKTLESTLLNLNLSIVSKNDKVLKKLNQIPNELSDKVIKLNLMQEEISRFFENDKEWDFYSNKTIIFFTHEFLDSGERLIIYKKNRGTQTYCSIEIKFSKRNIKTYIEKKIYNFINNNYIVLTLFAVLFIFMIFIKR
jgi:hypothetical protein